MTLARARRLTPRMWHSWEALRLEPGTGIAIWLPGHLDHLDHQLAVLIGRGRPFAQCSEDEQIEPRQTKAVRAPPGWWDTEPVPPAQCGDFGTGNPCPPERNAATSASTGDRLDQDASPVNQRLAGKR
jgi:hypothetical protein